MTIKVLGAEWEYGAQPPRANNAHAEGSNTIASGVASHAEGNLTVASAIAAHAEGQTTAASGSLSHAEGQSSTASGLASHAEAYTTQATGNYSHAEGSQTTASGLAAHAEGSSTTASGMNSHAGGSACTATGIGQWTRGSISTLSAISASRAYGSSYTMGAVSSSTTAIPLVFDGSGTRSISATNNTVLIIPNRGVVGFHILLVGRVLGSTNSCQMWQIVGGAYNDAGTVALLGTSIVTTFNAGASAIGTPSLQVYSNTGLVLMISAAQTTSTSWHAVMTTSELVTTS